MDNRSIGVFDSGLGGLTCVNELLSVLPDENIVYFGDTGRVPYGSRSEETIIKYVKGDIGFLLNHDIKLIVAACGTASTVALPHISDCPVPLIGVVEAAVEAAVSKSRNGRIGVIGTAGTISNGKYEKLIKQKNSDLVTIAKACPLFVPLVENGLTDHEITYLTCKMYLDELKEKDIDTLILGCTHYPMLKKVIGRVFGDNVILIDPGYETAHYVRKFLESNDSLAENAGENKYFVSDTVSGFEKTASLFMGRDIRGQVEKIDIEKY